MNESKRSAYLERLGTKPLYLRSPLGGAKKSPNYSFSKDPTPSVAKTLQVFPKVETNQPNIPAEPELRERPNSFNEKKSSNEDGSTPASSLRMTFQYYLIDLVTPGNSGSSVLRTFAVLSEIPSDMDEERDSLLMRDTGRLLLNILRALGAPIKKLPALNSFDWPLDFSMDSEKETSEEENVKSALIGFLQRQHERDLFEHMLLFGGGNRLAFDERDLLSFSLCKVYGLPEMLAVPSLKRQTWEDLQDFRKAISLGDRD
tara:strand:+ start:181 stop:957 length:777 start_codon:yes stop_codon:yes gene_type:complete